MSGTVVIPVEVIAVDDTTAKAIAQHHGDGRPLVIDGRCYLSRRQVDGRSVATLFIEAEYVLFAERDMSPSTTAATRLPLAS